MMKKMFLTVLAASTLVACNNDDVVSVKPMGQIAFSGAFVDNATRAAADPSTTTGSIKNFDVWGFMTDATGVVFNDEDVTKAGDEWTYKNTQYWSQGKSYWFAALSPMNSANVTEAIASGDAAKFGLGEISFTNADGSEDLLYAATTVTAPNNINSQPDPVKFQFNHLLSKVKFTFTNGFPNENTSLVIKDIKMTVPKSGKINLAQEDWWTNNEWELGQESFQLEFGGVESLVAGESDECTQERLTIPADNDQEYNVTFTVELYQGDVLANTFEEKTTVKGVALKIGYAYNFTAELNADNLGLYPITFEVVEVKDWIPAGTEFTDFDENMYEIASKVTLVSNAVAEKTVNVKEGGILVGAGHTLTLEEGTKDYLTSSTLRLLNTTGNVTIKDLVIDGNKATYTADKTYGIRGIFLNGPGKVNIDNVQILNCTYGINTGAAGVELNITNSTIAGWNSWDGTTSANFTNVKFIASHDQHNVRPYHSTTFKECTFNGKVLDISQLEAGQVLSLVNCYDANGTLITADNVSLILKEGQAYDAAKFDFNTNVPNVAAGETYVMTGDGVTEASVNVADGATLDGANYTLTVAETAGDNGIIRPAGTATVKNLTIDGQNKYYDTDKGMRAFFINDGGTYTIDNVIVKNVTYPINVNVSTADVVLNVSNSTLEGWTSYGSSTTATFDHVNFTKNSVNNLGRLRPYGTTMLKNCTFSADFVLDLSCLVAGEIVTFVDCSVNGTKLTEENVATLLNMTSEEAYAANKVSFLKSGYSVVEGITVSDSYTMANDVVTTGLVNTGDNTLDGGNNTLSIQQATSANLVGSTLRLINAAGNTTIKNLKIDGNNVAYGEYGIRAIYLTGANTTYTIDNVEITDVTYCLNDDSNAKTVNVTNSSFEGWTSYNPNTTATFKNVNFSKNPEAYGTFRPHGTTTLEECNFTADFTILLDKLAEGKTITFINCYKNGVRITAENVATMVESYDASKVIINNHI